MNKITLITSVAGAALMLASAAPALADDSATVDVHANVSTTGHSLINIQQFRLNASTTKQEDRGDRRASSTADRTQKIDDKAGVAIDARIKSLQQLESRLANIKLLPADILSSLQASLTTEISTLTDLKTKIDADTSTTTLKDDVQSITKANRVYILVEPKARIAAADSRIKAVVDQLTALGTKLQARITAAQGAGVDVSAAVTAMTDFSAKLADAKTQADAAVSETANLQADNGDKTIQASNTAALKDARTKLDAAQKDLAAARHDAATIFGVVKGHGGASASATASTTTP